MEIKDCKTCVNYLTDNCPFFISNLNDYINTFIALCGKREFGIDCWQDEEDKMLCDMMCGSAEEIQ